MTSPGFVEVNRSVLMCASSQRHIPAMNVQRRVLFTDGVSRSTRSSFAIDLEPHAPSPPSLFVSLKHPVHFADLGETFIHGWLLESLAKACERREGKQITLGLNTGSAHSQAAVRTPGETRHTSDLERDGGKLNARYRLLCQASSIGPVK